MIPNDKEQYIESPKMHLSGNEKEFKKFVNILGCIGVFPCIMHTTPKSSYLNISCNFIQNMTCNVFQSISNTISLNIVAKFGEYFPIL